ncbi:MAG: ECF-type sigma factor [Limisphaerales bacterium]
MTQVLEAVGAAEEQAAAQLLPLVYDELRRLAAQKMANEAPGQTLQPRPLAKRRSSTRGSMWRHPRKGNGSGGQAGGISPSGGALGCGELDHPP